MFNVDLNFVLAEVLEAEDAGAQVELSDYLRRYPQFAQDLVTFFNNREKFKQLATSLRPNSGSNAAGRTFPPRQFANYELLEEIGRGGMGIVYRARQATPEREVALKLILAGSWASDSEVHRFRTEAAAAARLDHPNIVPIYEIGEWEGQPYFTMKLINGSTLASNLDTWKYQPRSAAQLVITLARAVHYAHQHGVMHRDLKPANVLMENNGNLYLTDFGLAKWAGNAGGVTTSGAIVGTPGYMAPEQASGRSKTVTTRADVFSLGAILYTLVTGQPPFRGNTPTETLRQVIELEPPQPRHLNRLVENDLQTICLKCLDKDPQRRYGSGESLAEDLVRWLENRPVLAQRSRIWQQVSKWARRRPALASLVAVVALSTVALLVGSLWYNARLEMEIENVEVARAQADARESLARLHSYAAQVNLAYQSLSAGNVADALRLLDSQRPTTGQTDLRSFDWFHLWHRIHRGLEKTLIAGTSQLRCVEFLDSGNLFVAGENGTVAILDQQSGHVLTLNQMPDSIRALALSPQADCVAARLRNGVICVWNWPDGTERFSRRVRPEVFYTQSSILAFAPDGKALAVAIGSRVEIWDAATGELQSACQVDNVVNAIVFALDGRSLALATNGREVRLWNTSINGDTTILGSHQTYVLRLDVSPDQQELASASDDGIIKRWDLANGQEIDSLAEHSGAVSSLAYSPDGQSLASACEDGTVRVRNLRMGSIQTIGHSNTVTVVRFSPDSKVLAIGGTDGYVKLWNLASTTERESLTGHTGIVYAVAFSADGTTLASGSSDRTIRLWNLRKGTELAVLSGHKGWVSSVAFSADGSTLASGNIVPGNTTRPASQSGTVQFWNLKSRLIASTLAAHANATWDVVYATDGHTMATAGYDDGTVKVWDANTHRLRLVLQGDGDRIWCVAFSPDATLIAAGGSHSDYANVDTVKIWNATTGKIMLSVNAGWVWSIAFSPDGKLLATGSERGIVKLWNLANGRESIPIRGHGTAVKCVAFCPDGKVLATGSADKSIRLWDVVTGDERGRLTGHAHWVSSLSFSPDGTLLASGDWGGTIRLWRASSSQ